MNSMATTRIREDSTWRPDRYTKEFREIADRQLIPFGSIVVSFGCSTGAEVLSLTEHLEGCRFLGVDINHKALGEARRQFAHLPGVEFIQTADFFRRGGQYACIFALNVLKRRRRHPYLFEDFCNHIQELNQFVGYGGLLCLAGTSHAFEETPTSREYEKIPLACERVGLSAKERWIGYDFKVYRKNAHEQQTSF